MESSEKKQYPDRFSLCMLLRKANTQKYLIVAKSKKFTSMPVSENVHLLSEFITNGKKTSFSNTPIVLI